MVARGEIRLVHFEPSRGSQANKIRPAIVVSNDGTNEVADELRRGVITTVPLTSNIAKVRPYQVLVPASESGLRRDSKAQAELVSAVDVSAVGDLVGFAPPSVMVELDAALRLHLDL